MKFLLDTDHLSILQRWSGVEYVILTTRMAEHPDDDFALSIITFHEQLLGAHTYIARAKSTEDLLVGYDRLFRLQNDFRQAVMLSFNENAGKQYDLLLGQRIRIATMDLRIAAIAMANDLTLLTRNRRDFEKVPNLRLEDWTV